MKKFKLIVKMLIVLMLFLITVQILRAYLDRQSNLKLMPWHKISKVKELDYDKYSDIESYLADEKKFLEEIYKEVEIKKKGSYNRYIRGSQSSPYGHLEKDVNLSFEMMPKNPKGGILMLHGLTGSPYSMREMAKTFYDKGYYVLALRYPYHGTYPGELLNLNWKDFSKTAKFGAKIVKNKIQGIKNYKFYMLGFSTGATATLQYITHDISKDKKLPRPDGVFWLSPAMGIDPLAKYVFLDILVSKIPGLNKFAWIDIYPEYDMAKYNSFDKNSVAQVYTLIKESRKNLSKLSKNEKADLPPIYSYTSIQDATVDSQELFKVLEEIRNKKNELTIFDVNRKYSDLYESKIKEINFEKEIEESKIIGDIIVVSNMVNKTEKVELIKYSNGQKIDMNNELDFKWSKNTFSLAHISLPISPENPLYGKDTFLGGGNIKGENGTAVIPANVSGRLRYNDFFNYVEKNITDKIY
ncbi:alpha/beta hydrolase [Psychrilyobacter atlanticus]|uniref:alpha/beta hydrolase n=1 Tax=Psychrilyobacter atlanticus TaxID=271091 RepID=UPI00042A534E|nr:alpha/beta hydrolase [Psychrilyobacter atlanticus]